MRVLELSSREEAAAYGGKLFRRWGAQVVRVEPRDRRPAAQHLDIYLNSGKERLPLDLANGDDRRTLASIASGCDILITDHTPSEMDERGLPGLDSAAGPRVRVSITPFGRSGPYRDYQATPATLLALGGYTWLMGDRGRTPLTMPGNYPFYQAGTFAYLAALAALQSRPSSPVEIEVSVLECLAALHQFTDTMWLFGGHVRSRHGNRWENLCPTTLLPSEDGWYGVNILPNFWFSFAHMIGRPELATEGPLSTNAGRMEHEDEVEAIVQAALWNWPRKRIFKEGQESWRVPVGYAARLSDLLEDPHLTERSFWQRISAPGAEAKAPRTLLTPGSPFRVVDEGLPGEPSLLPAASAPVSRERLEPASPSITQAKATAPLTGIRVLDLTRIWSGPVATRILGDLGAEVIKIEAQTGRGAGRFPEGNPGERPWNRQPLFNKLNRNKKSIAIDLKAQKGREIFLDLVARSDVVIENFSARAMPGLGLSYEVLSGVNDQIVYLSMPAFGLFGPYRDYIGLGPSIEPITGMTALMGYSDQEPRVTSKAVTDPIAGVTAAAAVITALQRRAERGKGCLLDLSQHETGVALFGEHFIRTQLTGQEPVRLGNGHEEHAPHGVYRCRGDDEWIAIAVRSEGEWVRFCAALGVPELAADKRFQSHESRLENRAELDREIELRTFAREKRELEGSLQSRGIAAGAVLAPPEWLGDRHLHDRGFFVELTHREVGPTTWDGLPLLFNGRRGYEDWTAAPCLGEDNRSLLKTILGLSDVDIESLYAEGVLAESPPGSEDM